jgi:hypothetical protein
VRMAPISVRSADWNPGAVKGIERQMRGASIRPAPRRGDRINLLHCGNWRSSSDALGHFLPRTFVAVVAAVPLITDTKSINWRDRSGPILLQKSNVAGRLIFREITNREAIADSYSVTHIRGSPVSLT